MASKRDKAPKRQYPRMKEAACRFYEARALCWDVDVIGARLLELRRSPDEYWAFVLRAYGDFAGLPRCLNSEKAWARYAEHMEAQPATANVVARADVMTLEGRVRGGADVRKLLQDAHVGISPLYRHLTVMYFGFYDLAPLFRTRAEHQLRENPCYFGHYGDLAEHMPIAEEDCYESQL